MVILASLPMDRRTRLPTNTETPLSSSATSAIHYKGPLFAPVRIMVCGQAPNLHVKVSRSRASGLLLYQPISVTLRLLFLAATNFSYFGDFSDSLKIFSHF